MYLVWLGVLTEGHICFDQGQNVVVYYQVGLFHALVEAESFDELFKQHVILTAHLAAHFGVEQHQLAENILQAHELGDVRVKVNWQFWHRARKLEVVLS